VLVATQPFYQVTTFSSHLRQQTVNPPVSAVIVNYNAGMILTQCIQAVIDQVQCVVIVDNGSTDTSLTDLQTEFPNHPHISIIRSDTNRGFSAGCNLGLKHANTPYILFLNPDCLLGQHTVHRLMEAIESGPRIGMAGGLLVSPDGQEQGGGRRAIPTPWRAFVRAFGLYRLERYAPHLFFDFHLPRQPLPPQPITVEAISGALMLVRKQAIEDVGPWDEDYFLHCEDLDWCMRFNQKKWKIVFVPDAPATHIQGTCSRSRPYFVSWHKHKGMLRFYRKFFRTRYPGVLMLAVTLGIWLRFAVSVTILTIQHGYKRLKFGND